jgi:hypothetical protein
VIEGLVKNAEMADKENINSGFPLLASPAKLHRKLVSLFYESPNIPVDVFEKSEVIREEHYCVPSYLFYCNGTASYTYEVCEIREQTVVRDNGEKSWEETRRHADWKHMSGTIDTSKMLFASGNRQAAPQVKELYMFLKSEKLVDYDELEFPHDVVTCDYNLPQAASFNEYIKPYMETLLKKQAEEALKGKETRGLSMGGSRIDKDEPVRVFLGLYRVVFKYDGKEYSMWARGDGEKIFYNELPTERQEVLAEKEKILAEKERILTERQKVQEEKKQALDSMPFNKTGLLIFGIVVCVIAAFITFYFSAVIWWGVGFSAVAVLFGVLFPRTRKKGKEYDAQRIGPGKDLEEAKTAVEESKKDLEEIRKYFENLLPSTVQQFKSQKKALHGIYKNVTGNADAF